MRTWRRFRRRTMMITVHCDRTDCYCNEDGYCEADLGIQIDSTGECVVYEEREEQEDEDK